MTRLVLIDGNAILHRAFHALPPLTAPDGSIVNAVYGFTAMLLRIMNNLRPTHIAVAFDRAAPTFRQELYKDYQAQRPQMDDTLVPQVEKVHHLVKAFGIAIFEKDGYEADDVIGTLAKEAISDKPKVISKTKNFSGLSPITSHLSPPIDQVIIITGDRDLLQLVNDKVLCYMPLKGLSEAKLYGKAETRERLGVNPEQVPDYKALAGDASDNYPGIAGIGPKTAAELLETFGSLENILKAVKDNSAKFQKLPDGIQEKLKGGVEAALLSHTLATVKTDVPIDADYNTIEVKSLDTPEARKALKELNFKSLLKRLTGEVEKKPEKADTKKKSDKETEQLSLV